MDYPKVIFQIVSYNNRRCLPECLKSIFNQTYKDFQVLIIDNNSQDGTVEFVKKNYPEVTVFQNKKNFGFAKANNQGLRLLKSRYTVFCNPDIILNSDWLEKMVSRAESPEFAGFAGFSGKLLKLELAAGDFDEFKKTEIIDSCGLRPLASRRVVELGAGRDGGRNFLKTQEIFGPSGALALYRRTALEDCLVKTDFQPAGEYFDEDFFIYKEDVDLAWRVRRLGWRSLLVSEAVAYHRRAVGAPAGGKFRELRAARKKQSALARYFSYRNHFFLLLKNEFSANILKSFFPIFGYELKKFGYSLIFEPGNFKAAADWARLAGRMLEKRRVISAKSRIKPEEIEKWFS